MLDAIKDITDDNFFFQEDSAQVHCVCNTIQLSEMWFSCFQILPGSAEAQVIWGGIVKRLLIAYVIGNISAKRYQNPFMCVKDIVSQRWDVFLRHGVVLKPRAVSWSSKNIPLNLDFNEARDDGVGVASAGQYANHLHLSPDR